jgi:Domain of unknown function (DUF4331)
MSSHREAPEISKDPVADNADVYAFVSTNPNEPGTVTIISNFVPLQGPAGGPNFYEFGDDVLYSIYIDNDGDAQPEIEFQFQFTSSLRYDNTFLYNVGPIGSLDDKNWNARQFYTVTRIDAGHGPSPRGVQPGPAWPAGPTHATVLGRNLPCPPCNIGPHSTPNYETALAQPAVRSLPGGGKVFAGQRNDPFYVDLGAVFDLGDLRPFQGAFQIPPMMAAAEGVDATKQLNIHSLAIQIPISRLTRDGSVPNSVTDPKAALGIWSAASRRTVRTFDAHSGKTVESGPWYQVSRLGNPLFNEVIVPIAQKDDWNHGNPADDSEYLENVESPELANLIANALYKGAFPNLAAYKKPRADLVAILLTGIPNGVVPGATYSTLTGARHADMLRLNVAIPPAASPSLFGVLGNDLAGFPNGRRVYDDVVAIELRAIAGATIPLVDKSFTADGAAGALTQWKTEPVSVSPLSSRYLDHFPYVGTPYDGFDTPSS